MDGQKDEFMDRRTDERLKIPPCVLQDIGPLPTDRWTDRRTDKKRVEKPSFREQRGRRKSKEENKRSKENKAPDDKRGVNKVFIMSSKKTFDGARKTKELRVFMQLPLGGDRKKALLTNAPSFEPMSRKTPVMFFSVFFPLALAFCFLSFILVFSLT